IDRQIDGKLITANHTSTNPPDCRLPTSRTLPPHLSQHQQNQEVSPAFILDGGVYQGQSTLTQPADWNPKRKTIGSPLSIQQQQQQQQRPDYYQQANKTMSPNIYNTVPDPRTGNSVSNYYAHSNQPLSGDTSMPGNLGYHDDRAVHIPSNFDSAPSSFSSLPQFVPNSVGMGPRSVPKRSTFIRTRHFDTSTEDLLHDHHQQHHNQQQQQQQHNEYTSQSPNIYAPQNIRPTSNTRTIPMSATSGNNYNIRP
ncbi:unnamed protein product, partial [Rotaria socialis]